jgi:hypothetical protein
VEKHRQTAQVNADLAPPGQAVEHSREDRNTRSRIKNRRNSQPEQVHFDVHLNGATIQYTVTQITYCPDLT